MCICVYMCVCVRVCLYVCMCQMRIDFNPATLTWALGDGFKFDIVHLEREQSGSIKVVHRARIVCCPAQSFVAVYTPLRSSVHLQPQPPHTDTHTES